MALQPAASLFLYANPSPPRPRHTGADQQHSRAPPTPHPPSTSASDSAAPTSTSSTTPKAAAPAPLHSQHMMAAEQQQQQVSLEQQLAASILMHRQRLLQQARIQASSLAYDKGHEEQEEPEELEEGEEEEEELEEDNHHDLATHPRPVAELQDDQKMLPEQHVEAEQEQALNLTINTKPPVIDQSHKIQPSNPLNQQLLIHHQTPATHLRRLETHPDQQTLANRQLLFHNQQNSAAAAAAAVASLTSHLSGSVGYHVNSFGQLATSLVSSTSSASSASSSSSSGWSSAADSLASCSPDRAPATHSPASQQLHQSHHLHHHHHQRQQQQSPNNQQQQQYQHPHKPLFLHHLHQHHHELGPVHKTDSDDLDRIRNFIELFKARRGALGLTQKQAAQCFRAYTNDRYAFSDNFVGHFEGFQFRPQTAMTIADSLAEWLEYAENETRQGRQLNFMPGRVKETRKRKYEVIRIRDSAKRVLVEAFEKNKSPSTSELEQLSRKTNIPSRNIEIFFKNRRTSRQYHQ